MISQRIIRLFSAEQHLKNIKALGIHSRNVLINPNVSELYEIAFKLESPSDIHTKQTYVSNKGALCADSGLKKDRFQKNEKIVKDAETEKTVNWDGAKNVPLKKESFRLIEQFAIDYINHKHRCFVIDGYIGWNPETRLKVRTFSTRSYHALFMHNMLVRPTEKELLQDFSKGADVHVFNAGEMAVSKNIEGLGDTSVTALDLGERKLAILGTQFAGQMKKALFKIIHYTMPRKGVLTLRASATVSPDGNVTVICGRSAVGKNALFMQNDRKLISDDELAWSEEGVEGVQGGCYIKVHGHSPSANRYVDNAIKYGTLLQNVNFFPGTRQVNYNDSSLTTNLRAVFPFKYLPHAQIPPIGKHPNNFILLSSDLSGVLPLVSKLTPEQAVFYFLSGYTTKMTDPKKPQSLFSPCFGESSLPLNPATYAKLFYQKVKQHGTKVWLINSGWSKNSAGVSQPISFKNIENAIEAIISGNLDQAETTKLPIFGIEVPKQIKGIPNELLYPGWDSKIEYNEELGTLAIKFNKNYEERWRGKIGKLEEVLGAASPKV